VYQRHWQSAEAKPHDGHWISYPFIGDPCKATPSMLQLVSIARRPASDDAAILPDSVSHWTIETYVLHRVARSCSTKVMA
jgi:hypothetical protein